MDSTIPRLKQTNNGWQLQVDGKPFLMLAAELQNSSMSSSEFMKGIWPQLVATNVNTCLGPVTWEQIEPEEDIFVFDQLDNIVLDARSHGLRLVLLWFGAYKNGLSTYAPTWVKTNPQRFPRSVIRNAGGRLSVVDNLSLFHEETRNADSKAFGRLMKHIKEIDQGHHTVIMVQVENEVGIMGDSRDANMQANIRFTQPVPTSLVEMLNRDWDLLHPSLRANLKNKLNRSGNTSSWEDLLGKSTQADEIFMAYHFALYVEQVTAAGKGEYSLPMYTNVWQNYADGEGGDDLPTVVGGGGQPGDYPSGGGVINVLDIWRKFAPSLDFVAPDIYLNDYARTCAKYRHGNQALFIPEQRRDEYGARRVWTALGSYQALGTAPFGMDTILPHVNPFTKHYELLASVAPHIISAQQEPNYMIGFFFDELSTRKQDHSDMTIHTFEPWTLVIERAHVFGKPGPGFGIIIRKAQNCFLLIGEGFQVHFKSTNPRSQFTGILQFVEKEVVRDSQNTALIDGRLLNGDETRSGQVAVMPGENPDYGDFPISITIPARTRIAECTVYSLEEAGQQDRLGQNSNQ